MASIENMAEGTTGAEGLQVANTNQTGGREQGFLKHTVDQLSKIPTSSRVAVLKALPESEQASALHVLGLEFSGGAGPTWISELEEAKNQKSRFEEAKELYETLLKANLHRDKIPDSRKKDFDDLLETTQKQMQSLVTETVKSPVLVFAFEEILKVYEEIAQETPKVDADSSSYYSSPPVPKTKEERLRDIQKAFGKDETTGIYNYKETFWEYGEETLKKKFGADIDLRALRSEYEGISSYIASKIAVAVEKAFKGIPLTPGPSLEQIALGTAEVVLEQVGDRLLVEIQKDVDAKKELKEEAEKRVRRRARFKERLRYNSWRERFDFAWAQNAEELNDSVLDWLEFFQQQLPRESPEKVNQSIQTGRQNALSALEASLHRLEIPVRSQIAKDLRATIEGHVDVIGGVQLLESSGGFEAYTAYLEDFSNNFNAHHDAIYLRNPKAAIIHDFLSENDGEICLGGLATLEKPLPGEVKTFRGNLEEKAKIHAATHRIYIRPEDFVAAEGGSAVKTNGENLRYSWKDKIEELLIFDSKGINEAKKITDPVKQREALNKIKIRTGVFQKIKARLDDKDGLDGLSEEERRNIIRDKIMEQMDKFGNKFLMGLIKGSDNQEIKDRYLWKWVKDYNELREKNGLDPWYPTSWDMVRLSINNPSKLLDRSLSKEEFRSMIEEIDDPYMGLTDEQTRSFIKRQFKEDIERKLQVKNLDPETLKKAIEQEMYNRVDEINMKTEDVLFDREKRRADAERAFNVSRAYQKFLGLDARWGGLTTRVVAEDGETKLKTISSMARDILKAKIDKEEKEIEDQVTEFEKTLPAHLTQKQKEAAKTRKRRLFRKNAVFAATLGLREIGIANDLPIWNFHYYGDVSQIQAFAPLVGLTHNDKSILPHLLDRGRREMEAVYSFLADQYMEKNGGETLVVKDDPLIGFHDESWERSRVINDGGELAQRDLFECRFMISTSGGVKVPDLISKMGDLGIYDLLWEMGCQDMREFQGFIKRRDEVELNEQSFWNIRKWADPIKYAQRLRGAGQAKTFLVGGEVKGQGYVPGVFNEPYSGLWRYRDEFLSVAKWMSVNIKKLISGERKLPKNPDMSKITTGEQTLNEALILSKPEGMEAYRDQVLKILETKGLEEYLSPVAKDSLVKTGGEILKFLIDYMNSRSYVRNRAGYAPKNWQYDNELIMRALFAESRRRKAADIKEGELKDFDEKGNPIFYTKDDIDKMKKNPEPGGEALGGEHLSYAPEGRTLVANLIFESILRASSYHVLDKADARILKTRGLQVKNTMEAKRREIVARGLPDEVKDLIKQRELYLLSIHTSSKNLEIEKKRLVNQYYDEQLHKEFVGEWAARLVD